MIISCAYVFSIEPNMFALDNVHNVCKEENGRNKGNGDVNDVVRRYSTE